MPRTLALLALSAACARAAPLGDAPEQLFLSMGMGVSADTAASGGAVVTWATARGSEQQSVCYLSDAGPDDVRSLMSRVTEPGAPSSAGARVIAGTPWSYEYTDAWNGTYYESGDMHRCKIDGLLPRTQYWYSVGAPLASEVRSFRTAAEAGYAHPPGPDGTAPQLEVVIIGDIGQTVHSATTLQRACPLCAGAGTGPLPEEGPDFALIVGDLSYADGEPDRWDSFGRLMDPVASRLNVQAFPGNHEIEMDKYLLYPFINYRNRYSMSVKEPETILPSPTMPTPAQWNNYSFDFTYEGGSSYYSYDVGRAHFICLNTYADSTVGSAQYAWLEADLKAVDREATPWVFAFFHGPFYSTNREHHGEVATLEMTEAMEPLFAEHLVAAGISGHVHSYERTHSIRFNKTVPEGEGTVYITIGDGGNHEPLYDIWPGNETWSAYRNGSSWGHARLKLLNDTAARWEWYGNGGSYFEDDAIILNTWKIANPDAAADDDGVPGQKPVSRVAILVLVGAMAVSVLGVVVLAKGLPTLRRSGEHRLLDDDAAAVDASNISLDVNDKREREEEYSLR